MWYHSVFVLLFSLMHMSLSVQAAYANPSEIAVKILTVKNPPSYHQPWQNMGRHSANGTGFVIEGKRILTSAHVVSNAVFIHVRRAGRTEKFPAEVEYFDHESDLALLKVEDDSFFAGVTPLPIGKLPEVRDKVAVYGFPDGGDKLSITEGVVSRIEHINYSYSGAFLLTCQIDASINTGNSGGPVVFENEIVGVAFQGMNFNYENIGYMVPSPVILQFLKDTEDHEINGVPDLGITMQRLESPFLREFYHLRKDENGALVTRVLPGSPAEGLLHSEDVILSLEGQDVAYDGTIEFRKGQRTYFGYILQKRQLGDVVDFDIKRNGKDIKISIPLTKSSGHARLVKLKHEAKPRYYIFGGLVFQPLSLNYLYEFGSLGSWFQAAPVELMDYYLNKELEFEGHEIVVLSQVLADKINIGYHELGDNVVKTVNGVRVDSFEHFISLVENADDKYLIIEINLGTRIIVDRVQLIENTGKIIKKYSISSDRRL